ncbi:MAG: DUF4291 family protein [Planctomycetaceae bacterium]
MKRWPICWPPSSRSGLTRVPFLNQTVVTLAIRIVRSAFEELLAEAVHSTFNPHVYAAANDWKKAVEDSDVRLQWDPDHGPNGNPLPRRAIQLGLRGSALRRYARDWIIEIENISAFVESQRKVVESGDLGQLVTPMESVFEVTNSAIANRLGLDHGGVQKE